MLEQKNHSHEFFIGVMSGTSLDGIDAVLCRFASNQVWLIETQTHAFDPILHKVLTALCQPNGIKALQHLTAEDLRLADAVPLSELDWFGWASIGYAKAVACAVQSLLTKAKVDPQSVVALGCHGQTVRHRPELGFSLQLLDANALAEYTGIGVVSDFRRRDMAVGGQGAPLVPGFHRAFFADSSTHRVVLNLGGIANVTLLPAGQPELGMGFDTGPANLLMDAWYRLHAQYAVLDSTTQNVLSCTAFDKDGAWAASGQINSQLLERLLAHPFFEQSAPKSTGREDFHLGWLHKQLLDISCSPADVQATLAQLTAYSVADALLKQTKLLGMTHGEVLVCGGGAYNKHLMQSLQSLLPDWEVLTTQSVGILPTWVEACAFAWLAQAHIKGETANLPAATGASHGVILGQYCPP